MIQLSLIVLHLNSGVIFSAQSAAQAKCACNSVIMPTIMVMLGKAARGCWEKVVIDSFAFSPAIRVSIKRHPLFLALSYPAVRWNLWQGKDTPRS